MLNISTTRDKRTYQHDPHRVGCVGHPSFGRPEELALRTTSAIKNKIVQLAEATGLSQNDVANNFLALGLFGPPDENEQPPSLQVPIVAQPTTEIPTPSLPNPSPEISSAPAPTPARATPFVRDHFIQKLRSIVGEETFQQWLYAGAFPIREYGQVLEFVCHNAVFQAEWKERFLPVFRGILADLGLNKMAVVRADPSYFHAPPQTESTQEAPQPTQAANHWQVLAPRLKARVSEQNFEVWLSSIRLASFDGERMALYVPNVFFQEYLTEHYTEVVQEVLAETHGKPIQVTFEVGTPVVVEPPKPAPTKAEEPPKDPILARLEAEAADFRRLDPRNTNEVIKAKLAVLLSKIHERQAALRRKVSSQTRTPAWETDGGYTKGDVSEASRSLNKGKKPDNKDYS